MKRQALNKGYTSRLLTRGIILHCRTLLYIDRVPQIARDVDFNYQIPQRIRRVVLNSDLDDSLRLTLIFHLRGNLFPSRTCRTTFTVFVKEKKKLESEDRAEFRSSVNTLIILLLFFLFLSVSFLK